MLTKINKSKVVEKKKKSKTITDGYMIWINKCSRCKKASMEVVRPGKIQCKNCG